MPASKRPSERPSYIFGGSGINHGTQSFLIKLRSTSGPPRYILCLRILGIEYVWVSLMMCSRVSAMLSPVYRLAVAVGTSFLCLSAPLVTEVLSADQL